MELTLGDHLLQTQPQQRLGEQRTRRQDQYTAIGLMHQTGLQADLVIVDPDAAKQLFWFNPLLKYAGTPGGKWLITAAGRFYTYLAALDHIVTALERRIFGLQLLNCMSDQRQILARFLRFQQHETRWRLWMAKQRQCIFQTWLNSGKGHGSQLRGGIKYRLIRRNVRQQ